VRSYEIVSTNIVPQGNLMCSKRIVMKEYKPEEYNSVSPYFVVNGAQKFAKLLIELFDGTEKRKFEKEDGSIIHMEIQIDDSILMISDGSDQYQSNQHLTHVYVPDVDEIFKKASELGCQILDPPKIREGDPNKRGTFKDFAGNIWSVATQCQ
jgi:PhnB protein